MKPALAIALASFGTVYAYAVRVTSVVDGDTFDAQVMVRPGLVETLRVRLPCGDAQELRADSGIEAKHALQAYSDAGVLVTAWRRDKYGRLLADLLVGNESVCARLIDAGYVRKGVK